MLPNNRFTVYPIVINDQNRRQYETPRSDIKREYGEEVRQYYCAKNFVTVKIEPGLEQSEVSNNKKAALKKTTTEVTEGPAVDPTYWDEISRTCKTCGKLLASMASLYVHMKSHSSNKPYACELCESKFTRKYYLAVHTRSHTGERPFKCKICQKCFSQKSSLNTHYRTHTGEKPYHCQHCGKSFSAQSYLFSHQWSHFERDETGVFNCPYCEGNFTNRAYLVEHMRIHAGTLEFKCESCFKRFSKEAFLIRHKKTAHVGKKNK